MVVSGMNFLLGTKFSGADLIHDQFVDIHVCRALRFCVGTEPNLQWIMGQDMMWFKNEFN